MSTPEPAGSASTEQLRREVAELRHELALLREDLRREVRTERLAVVDPVDGRELVWTETRPASAGLHVRWDDAAECALVAGRESDNPGDATLSLSAGEEIAVMLSAALFERAGRSAVRGDLCIQDGEWVENGPALSSRWATFNGDGVEIRSGEFTARARLELDSTWGRK